MRHKPKLLVLSIDGVPYELLRRMMEQGDMPHLAELARRYPPRKMRSVVPTVSCVAWASYLTGMNPGKHGIYGFIDRKKNAYELVFPNAGTMAVENIFELLSGQGRRVFGMNVPSTYPPRRVNGVLIGCFLSPSLAKAAYPPGEAEYLRAIGYRIDSDATLARRDKRAMLADLDITLEKRMQAMEHYLDLEDWDFFHTHIMGSDRINHFLWRKMEQDDPEFSGAFFAFYRKIDQAIGKILQRLGDEAPLLIFSDHGFCSIKEEVQLSRYLVESGFTQPAANVSHPLAIEPERSRAYCLIPGRIYVNLKGREPGGIVPVEEYEQTRRQLAEVLMQLRAPSGEPVMKKVLMREEVYWPTGSGGAGPAGDSRQVALAEGIFGQAADLLAIPHDGYDLKLGLAGKVIFQQTELEGMHTYDNAFIISRGIDLPQDNLEILMLTRAIMSRLGTEPPADMDGQGDGLTPPI